MNRLLLLITLCLELFCNNKSFAQAGAVYTVAGGGTSTADGVPSTSAYVNRSSGVAVDADGNVYYGEQSGCRVRRVDGATGLVSTIAGTGSCGFSGDGGTATSAQLNAVQGLCLDGAGNVFIADEGNGRIRKVHTATGIITTVAGGGSSGADGVSALTAYLTPLCVYVDSLGNIYTGSNGKVRKVDGTTGIITSVAGGGTSSADGVPALSASLGDSVRCITLDDAGNLYVIDDYASKVRKVVAATGLIFTVAGGGTSLAEGIPATDADFGSIYSCSVDGGENIFIADGSRRLIRRVDGATGLINTIAGVGTSGGSTADGTAALSAAIRPYMIYTDPVAGIIYYSDRDEKVKRFSYAPIIPFTGTTYTFGSDSCYISSLNKQCAGPQIIIRTVHMHAGMTVETFYGDGSSDVGAVVAAYSVGGYTFFSHTYAATGTYTIKHVLYSGTLAVDSFTHMYNHAYCATLPVRFYNDDNSNCAKESSEPFLARPIKTEIDSNGTPVDTVSSTNGFDYTAYGNPGDVYRFKVISLSPGDYPSCPTSGIITQTLPGMGSTPTINWFAINCSSGGAHDLSVRATTVSVSNRHWGHIYVQNHTCIPASGEVKLSLSPKYIYAWASPMPTSIVGNTIIWNSTTLSSAGAAIMDISYRADNSAAGVLLPGDTVHDHFSIVSAGGTEFDLGNNTAIAIDTVRTSYDPNTIEVTPAACFDSDTTFEFTVHFENMGNDTADNIHVMDTLSDNLDPATIEVLMNTHPMFISKWNYGGRAVVKFDFPDIKLLDSSHHGLCDGAFIYSIRNKAGLATGTAISSRVGIYFDYNDVVMTNTVTNTKGCPVVNSVAVTSTSKVSLHPNPATDLLTITTDGSYTSFTITNSMGQTMMQQELGGAQSKVSVKALPAGVYMVSFKGEQGSRVERFVKW
ncbi:MAG: T9SS type A sorting domain-containing protein [Bacteroidota bacterium]